MADYAKIHPEVDLSLKLEEEYRGNASGWAKNFIEANQFRLGIQWTKTQKNKMTALGQVPLVVNRMLPMIETAKSILTYNRPEFSATGREDSDVRTAKVWADLYSWMWGESNGNELLKQTIDDYYVGGRGDMRLVQDAAADMGKGEVRLESLYPLDVLYDPNARKRYCQDAANIIVSQVLTDEEGIKTWPDYKSIILAAEEAVDDSYETGDYDDENDISLLGTFQDITHKKRKYIERQTKIRIPMFHCFETHSGSEHVKNQEDYTAYLEKVALIITDSEGQETFITSKRHIVELENIMQRVGRVFHMIPGQPSMGQNGQMQEGEPQIVAGEEDQNSIPKSTRYIEHTTIAIGVERGFIMVNDINEIRIKQVMSVGRSLLFERTLPSTEYTIVPLMNVHNRTPLPESDVRLYKGIQQYINKLRSLIMAHASQTTSQKLLIPRGSVNKKQVEVEFGKIGTAVIEFDADIGQPVIVSPIALSNELYRSEADAKYDLEYGLGIFELMQGSSKNAPNTYRGTLAIEEFGNRRIKSRRDDIEGFLNQIGKAAIPLMQEIYTEQKVIRLVQPNNIIKETQINQPIYDEFTGDLIEKINDISVGRYDVKVVSGSMLPSNRWAQFEYYKELYTMKVIDQVELLKKTEIVDQQGVLERFSYVTQLENQLAQTIEKVKELQGDLQTSDREAINARKRLEVNKFATELKQEAGKAMVATELHKVKLQDALNKANAKKESSSSKGS